MTIPVGSTCSIAYLEHVQAITTLSVKEGRRGDINLKLTSPSQTTSLLLPYRNPDYHQDGFDKWPFMTVHSWGEAPGGEWKFIVETRSQDHKRYTKVSLNALQLVLFGTKSAPPSVQSLPTTCHSECAGEGRCSGAGSASCDKCKNFRVVSTHECVGSCPKGTYENFHMCRDCPEFCAECPNAERCTRCKDEAVRLENGLCAESCPQLYFLSSDNHSCQPCHHSCLDCDGPSDANCTSCPRQFSLERGSCILSHACPSEEYFDDRALECRRCHKSCAQCTGKEDHQCTACFPGFVVSEGMCVVDTSVSEGCGTGQYLDDSSSSCTKCPDGCADCSDEITCTDCEESHFLETQRVGDSPEETKLCVDICSRGFYGDPQTKSCAPCPSYCTACDSPDRCTACALKNFTSPVKGQCPQPCHEEQYYDFEAKQCQACIAGCHLCVNKDGCRHCLDGFFLSSDTKCVRKCPGGTVADKDTRTCQDMSCHSSCLTCYGPGPDECMSCMGGMVLHDNACIDNCPPHTYFNGTHCHPCHSSCATCAGSTEEYCLSCSEGNVLDHYHCVSTCPPRSFNFSGQCLACPMDCQACSVLGRCDQCDPGHRLLTDGECITCPDHCANCSRSDRCDLCDDGFLLLTDSGACVSACPTGHFQEGDTCQACLPHCGACSSTSSCDSCRDGFYYYEPGKSCLSNCPDGYYGNPKLKKCTKCQPSCSQCSGPAATDCQVCSEGFVMDKVSSKCRKCCISEEEESEDSMCCDCSKDNENCVHSYASNQSQKEDKDDDDKVDDEDKNDSKSPIQSATSLAITLAVVGVIMLIVIVAVGACVVARIHRSRKNRDYSPVASEPLRIDDNDSGSEFDELYTKT